MLRIRKRKETKMGLNYNHKEWSFEEAKIYYDHRLCEQIWGSDSLGRGTQILNLMDFLEQKTNFMECPASSKYHLCTPGGLFIHSCSVAQLALELNQVLSVEYPESTVALCAFTHDLGKLGAFRRVNGELQQDPRYLTNPSHPVHTGKTEWDEENWRETQPYIYNQDLMALDSGTRSLRLVDKFVDLTEAEAQAILAHDGQYVDANRQYAQKETPLLLLIHFSDMYVGRVVEGNIDSDWKMNGVFDLM